MEGERHGLRAASKGQPALQLCAAKCPRRSEASPTPRLRPALSPPPRPLLGGQWWQDVEDSAAMSSGAAPANICTNCEHCDGAAVDGDMPSEISIGMSFLVAPPSLGAGLIWPHMDWEGHSVQCGNAALASAVATHIRAVGCPLGDPMNSGGIGAPTMLTREGLGSSAPPCTAPSSDGALDFDGALSPAGATRVAMGSFVVDSSAVGSSAQTLGARGRVSSELHGGSTPLKRGQRGWRDESREQRGWREGPREHLRSVATHDFPGGHRQRRAALKYIRDAHQNRRAPFSPMPVALSNSEPTVAAAVI
ncbi:unnamed protein product [Prorocentrum cordatum]|uniref:Uncharacterized protein n=1 Tax=Prorocentrum cordatum TaxID=2364126 RepID=A0ABN9U0Y1_9DINO|nr:unnamed protein product [Polarella glacialis]